MPKEGLQNGPLTASCAHLCIDMQTLFAAETDWHTPWMTRVLPVVERLVAARPDRTIFTRFIPGNRPGEGSGTWRAASTRWWSAAPKPMSASSPPFWARSTSATASWWRRMRSAVPPTTPMTHC
jgi:nicotinamidase-related amidase